VRHVREAVRFADGVAMLHGQGVRVLLEIGPKPVLLGMAGPCLERSGDGQRAGGRGNCFPALASPWSGEWQQLLASLGELYVRGVAVDWEGFEQGDVRRKVVLPTYPFQRQRYWVEPARQLRMAAALRPLVDRSMELPSHQETIFEKTFSTETLSFLADHHVYGEVVVPGACHLSLALSCAELFYKNTPCRVEDVIFPQALVLMPGVERRVQLIMDGEPSNPQHSFEILSVDSGEDEARERKLHATGRLMRSVPPAAGVDLSALRARCSSEKMVSIFFDRLAEAQVVLGSSFRWITEVWTNGQKKALARLQKPQSVPALEGYPLFPSLIDSCFQLVSAVAWTVSSAETPLPFGIDRLIFYGAEDAEELWCHVVHDEQPGTHSSESGTTGWKITLCTEQGQVVAAFFGFQMRAVPARAIQEQASAHGLALLATVAASSSTACTCAPPIAGFWSAQRVSWLLCWKGVVQLRSICCQQCLNVRRLRKYCAL
jgi:acyl transferase domain-containing protein